MCKSMLDHFFEIFLHMKVHRHWTHYGGKKKSLIRFHILSLWFAHVNNNSHGRLTNNCYTAWRQEMSTIDYFCPLYFSSYIVDLLGETHTYFLLNVKQASCLLLIFCLLHILFSFYNKSFIFYLPFYFIKYPSF